MFISFIFETRKFKHELEGICSNSRASFSKIVYEEHKKPNIYRKVKNKLNAI